MRKPTKMNILYICPDETLGGSTRSLLNLILSIKEKITPIVLFSAQGNAYDKFKELGIECISHPFVKLHQCLRWKNIILHPWRIFLVRFIRQDVTCVWYVKRYLKGRKIDIVHSNYSPIYVGRLLSTVLHSKHVWHVREFIDLDFNCRVYGGIPLLRRMVNHADARVAITSAIKKHWQMPSDNTWVINNAVLCKKDVCFNTKKDKYLLYSAYFMSEQKGARTAIITFAKSEMAKEGYVLKMVGNCLDDFKESLLQTIREFGISDNVEFLPCQSNLKPFFAKATAYLMTSEFEAMGRVTAEAMFYGCPVIAHATGGTLDLVKNGETGYLYSTLEECAEYIRYVCENSQDIIIRNAQEFALNNLSQEEYGPQIMEVYKSVLND